MNKHRVRTRQIETAKSFKDANIRYSRTAVCPTLSMAISYARERGFTPTDLQCLRKAIHESREKYPRSVVEWRGMVIKFHRKNRYECGREDGVVEVLQVKRHFGVWKVRIVETDEAGWFYGRDWNAGDWGNSRSPFKGLKEMKVL